MYENGKPFFKEWNVVILFECIVGDFHTSMRVFMEFVKDSFEQSKRKAYTNSVLYKISEEDWFITVGFVIYRLIRFVDSSMKSCENLL